ncbi:hypothetical protein ACSZMU_14745 [Aeromonas caviae]|uniref:hypothetical protein n=1 Tax=Aeromonas caviae TaxID=648 RepID=UPI00224D40C7|nr:hypothetical protein [Aeromonas caviae]MCX4036447.1 hypothetical protein [Aeromonas caviae]
MKDLLICVADADAEAFLRSMLVRNQALGIRAVTFDIMRHPQRDAGMVQTGAELARMHKGKYSKLLMLWDFHGSGRERRQSVRELEAEIGEKLDAFTWSGNHAISVMVPELEQWLWFCEPALASYSGLSSVELQAWVEGVATKSRRTVESWQQENPKELFEQLMRDRLKRTISPRDFERIGERASVRQLEECGSFKVIVDALRVWFASAPTE